MRHSQVLKVALFACLQSSTASKSLSDVLRSRSSFSLLTDVLDHHDLLKYVDSVRNTTFFAPNNDALLYLADFGINLTTVDVTVVRALINYGLTEGIHSVDSVKKTGGHGRATTALLPPSPFSNVTAGQAVKLHTNTTENGTTSLLLESGLQILTHVAEEDNHIVFDHGIIHATSTNMVLPENISDTTSQHGMTEFYRLIRMSGTEEMLNHIADATFFIPRDESIVKLRPLLDMLSSSQLKSVVMQHVVQQDDNGVLYEDRLTYHKTLRTLAGGKLSVARDNRGQLSVNGSRMLQADMLLRSGVGHLIENVILPAQESIQHTGNRQSLSIDDMAEGAQRWSSEKGSLIGWLNSRLMFGIWVSLAILVCVSLFGLWRVQRSTHLMKNSWCSEPDVASIEKRKMLY